MSHDQSGPKPTRLIGLDREIAVRAIAALARGTPVEAAYQILAGIEALDAGPEAPLVMLWPKGYGYETLEDKAAWHEAERYRFLSKIDEFQRSVELARQRKTATRSGGALEGLGEAGRLKDCPAAQQHFEHQQGRAGSPSAPAEAVPAIRALPLSEPPQAASDE
ncbi:hypothetical protein ACU7AI_17865 [Pseudomonas aeruginosa]